MLAISVPCFGVDVKVVRLHGKSHGCIKVSYIVSSRRDGGIVGSAKVLAKERKAFAGKFCAHFVIVAKDDSVITLRFIPAFVVGKQTKAGMERSAMTESLPNRPLLPQKHIHHPQGFGLV